MKVTIELDRETDGRWIADVPELNVLLYGSSKEDAIQRAENAAREIIADRISRGMLPSKQRIPFSRSRFEQMACDKGAARFRRSETDRLAARSNRGLTSYLGETRLA